MKTGTACGRQQFSKNKNIYISEEYQAENESLD